VLISAQETLNFWKQLSHVLKYFRAEEDPKARLQSNFINGFLEVRSFFETKTRGVHMLIRAFRVAINSAVTTGVWDKQEQNSVYIAEDNTIFLSFRQLNMLSLNASNAILS
jgi:hypothetical protein